MVIAETGGRHLWNIDKLEQEIKDGHVIIIALKDEGITGVYIDSERETNDFYLPNYKSVPESITSTAKQYGIPINDERSFSNLFRYIYLIAPLLQFALILITFVFVLLIYKNMSRIK